MRKCAQCQGRELREVEVEHARRVGNIEFRGKVSALQCRACKELYYDGPALDEFDRAVLRDIVHKGVASGEALKFMRAFLGLKAVELASLLRLTPEAISRVETGKTPADVRTLALLQGMVLDELAGRRDTRDRLEALQQIERTREDRIDSYRKQLSTLPPGPKRQQVETAMRDWLTMGPRRIEAMAQVWRVAKGRAGSV